MSTALAKPTLQAPITGQALRQSVAAHDTAEWTAYARSLRIAGYRVDSARLAEQLLRNGCASVHDAFGHEVTVQVRVPRPPVADEAAMAATSAQSFNIAC